MAGICDPRGSCSFEYDKVQKMCDAQNEPKMCCRAMTADCMSCSAGMSKEEFCKTEKGQKV